MILNRPMPVAVDEAHDRYVVNLQISWPQNISGHAGVPNMYQLLGDGVTRQTIFIATYRDDFDVRSVSGNVVLPEFRSIVGTVIWSLNGSNQEPGHFHIFQGGSGLIYSFRPSHPINSSGTAWKASARFALPIVSPEGSYLSFFMSPTAGFYSGCANLALLTWPVSYFFRSN